MAKATKRKKKGKEALFSQEPLRRTFRKTILFNSKEVDAINRYCEKYGIHSKSAFFRNVIISHILEQTNANYPKLF